jgi:hypothetical protein
MSLRLRLAKWALETLPCCLASLNTGDRDSKCTSLRILSVASYEKGGNDVEKKTVEPAGKS